LVTGFYGMNVPYPGFSQQSGVWASIAVMLTAAIALYFVFRRNDWL
jgi:magnesium transporter